MGKTKFMEIFMILFVLAAAGCGGGNGREEQDADADQEILPEVGEDMVQPDLPAEDIIAEDPGVEEAAVEDMAADDVVTDEGVEEELPPAMTFEEFCIGRVEDMCRYTSTCCTADEAATILWLRFDCDDPPSSRYIAECFIIYNGGRMRINEAAMLGCQAAINALVDEGCLSYNLYLRSVDELFRAGACAGVLEGLVAEGEYCTEINECAGGYCAIPPSTCEPYVSDGDACHHDHQCAPGSACILDICSPLAGEGEDCDDDDDCHAAFYCDMASCIPLETAGTICRMPGVDRECEGECHDPGSEVLECIDYCDVV